MADSPVFVQWNGTKSRPDLQKIVLYFLENTMKKQESSVYEVLREKILSLELKPGQELNINQLAKEMNVSRSPIRDALLRLSLDKLVDVFPQKGTRVAFLDKDIIKQERFLRITLELGVLKVFMKSLDENKRKICATKLQAILLEQHATLLDGNKKAFMQKDDELHYFFYAETKNEWLWKVLDSHTGNDHRIRVLSYNADRIANSVEKEHIELVKAIENGDSELARKVDEEHMQVLSDLLEDMNKNYPEYFSVS